VCAVFSFHEMARFRMVLIFFKIKTHHIIVGLVVMLFLNIGNLDPEVDEKLL
jgi:hypothetical protein